MYYIQTEGCLGDLLCMHVWHDNMGPGKYRDWYLDEIMVDDLQTKER